MSGHDHNLDTDEPEHSAGSIANPFAEGSEAGAGDAETEKPQLNLSKSRAAMLGLGFGAIMVGLLVVCFLLALLLATCTGTNAA